MKFKPTDKAGGLVVELGPREAGLPPLRAETQPAFKLKKILVPVDFSECSKKALAYAIPLAEEFGAELTLLHVAASLPPIPEWESGDVVAVDEAVKQLKALHESVGATLPPPRVHEVVRTGAPGEEIIRAAQEMGIDLIVLSTHGHTGLARVIMGSTAERVVRHAGCPVLVVREHEHEFVAGVETASGCEIQNQD